ncbi:DUF695 domain-containing protein [Arcobacter sp. LA11]|uniref:DUF695 domain-containing protein n=1 Tax=Arcobacter sp. LA11 TaxID=1898176 RepID=UPI000932B84C|nr:DUF695 domain-containing protein [Arcobacter sp. LA11]
MNEKWLLKDTGNLNQMLRIRADKTLTNVCEKFKDLVIVKHQYHIADDIMFPDPSCLAFFTAFEENHLQSLEEEESLVLYAVDIFEGKLNLYIYCNDAQKCVYNSISFLKSNSLYKCEFEIILNDYGKRLEEII